MDQSHATQAGTPVAATPSELYTRLNTRLQDGLPGLLGLELVEARPGFLTMQVTIRPHHLAANGYLHAGSVVTLADTACGFGCLASLPEGAHNFTTIELKSNFLRTAISGQLRATATLVHGGRRTQVWDAAVIDQDERTLALFRCTQMLLYPEQGASPIGSRG
ncbi:MAG: PaaI family thioesterase [Caldilineaceae bacterium]|nr:PaaI family thioesterase [Caldilineaceae bacterium]